MSTAARPHRRVSSGTQPRDIAPPIDADVSIHSAPERVTEGVPSERGWRATWMSGPDAGRSHVLRAGEHVVGRSPLAAASCDDPSLEPFHLRLRLGPLGGDSQHCDVQWCQLTGRRPVQARGDEFLLGASVLRVEPAPELAASVAEAGPGVATGGVVVRRPRRRIHDPALPLDAATRHDLAMASHQRRSLGDSDVDADAAATHEGAATTLLPAAVTLGGGVVLAVALGQPMLLLMGVIGAALALTMWCAGLVRGRRRRRRRQHSVIAAAARLEGLTNDHRIEIERARRLAQPGLPGIWRTLADTASGGSSAAATSFCPDGAPALWERRPDHGDAFTAVVGIGLGTTPAIIDHQPWIVLDDVPTLTDLGAGARLAVTGAWAHTLARSLLVQLAVTTGPADWHLVVAVDDEAEWRWTAVLPHLRSASDGAAIHGDAALGDLAASTPDGRHLIVVTDAIDRIAVRTAGLRRLLHARPDAALLIVASDVVPALCTTIWTTAADGTVRSGGGELDRAMELNVAVSSSRCSIHGLGLGSAAEAAERLSRWTDPEAPVDDDRRIANAVGLEELWSRVGLPIDRNEIARRWRSAGADAPPAAPVGAAAEGAVELDLVRDGPHALVAGTTGSGKSELLRSLVLSLATSVSPSLLAFVLVDFKGGATFDGLSGLPHVAGVVTDLEPRLAARVLRSLRAEVTRREQLLRDLGAPDLSTARTSTATPVAPRLVIVVDEFAALAIEHPQLLHSLVDIARRGRSLGVHLVLATQRPAGIVSEEIRTNTDLRIALRLHDAAEAIDVVGDPSPASIRRAAAGRAVVRLGPGELLAFQAARPGDASSMVEEIRQAAASLGMASAARPWCEPLPDRLDDDPIAADRETHAAAASRRPRSLGLIDLPDEQRQEELAWSPADGHVLVVGSVGSGVTTALAGFALRGLTPQAELVVVDALGDHRWAAVADHPRCAAVAPLHDVELVERVLRRAVSTPPDGGRILVLDGLAVLRRDLEPLHRLETRERLDALLLSPPPGVTLVVGNDGVVGLSSSVISRCARRFVLHLHDPAEAAGLGVRIGDVPIARPGRFVDAVRGCEGQFATWPQVAAVGDVRPGVARVTTLPVDVAAGAMISSWCDPRSWLVPVGIAHDDLAPAVLEVPNGEHLLVLGPARSGRSEVLAGVRRCWSQARPDAAQVVIAPRRLSGEAVLRAVAEAIEQVEAELAGGRPVLLVIDDADLVTDASGVLTNIASKHQPLLTMAVSCRPDTVRSSHGHWAASLRRHRRGIMMAACDELDGDLLGAMLPRHLPIAVRPGLCWLIGDGSVRLVQAARRGTTS